MRNVKLGVIVGLSIVLVLIIVQNTTPVPGRFLWFSGQVPAVVLLFVTTTGGFVTGLLVALFYGHTNKKKRVPYSQYTETTYKM